jgi:hypothetical protein
MSTGSTRWCGPAAALLAALALLGGCRCGSSGPGEECTSKSDCMAGLICDPQTMTCQNPNGTDGGGAMTDAAPGVDGGPGTDSTPGADSSIVGTDATSGADAAPGTDATTMCIGSGATCFGMGGGGTCCPGLECCCGPLACAPGDTGTCVASGTCPDG